MPQKSINRDHCSEFVTQKRKGYLFGMLQHCTENVVYYKDLGNRYSALLGSRGGQQSNREESRILSFCPFSAGFYKKQM